MPESPGTKSKDAGLGANLPASPAQAQEFPDEDSSQQESPGSQRRHGYRQVCPVCRQRNASRTRRRNLWEYLISMAGVRPYHCERCDYRFHRYRGFRFRIPIHLSTYASCPRCQSTALQRVSKNRVPRTTMSYLPRLLSVPAYRCSPCRVKFFSARRLKRPPGHKGSGKRTPDHKEEDRSHASPSVLARTGICNWARWRPANGR